MVRVSRWCAVSKPGWALKYAVTQVPSDVVTTYSRFRRSIFPRTPSWVSPNSLFRDERVVSRGVRNRRWCSLLFAAPGRSVYTFPFWNSLLRYGSMTNSTFWFDSTSSSDPIEFGIPSTRTSDRPSNHATAWSTSAFPNFPAYEKLAGSPWAARTTIELSMNVRSGFGPVVNWTPTSGATTTRTISANTDI